MREGPLPSDGVLFWTCMVLFALGALLTPLPVIWEFRVGRKRWKAGRCPSCGGIKTHADGLEAEYCEECHCEFTRRPEA